MGVETKIGFLDRLMGALIKLEETIVIGKLAICSVEVAGVLVELIFSSGKVEVAFIKLEVALFNSFSISINSSKFNFWSVCADGLLS